MIDLDTLKVGDVVQLKSGSPYMTVRGFREARHAGPGRPDSKVTRTQVTVILWSQRLGFLEKDFRGEELRWPPPRAPLPATDADLDPEEAIDA